MTETNRQGLSRYIPEQIARKVRQECGFGCVICGTALYHYEHISPEFKDAFSHDVENIALLCAMHHDLVTRGHLSKSAVAKARLAPKAKETGVAGSAFEIGSQGFKVLIGGATFEGGACVGALGELPLLLLLPPEEQGEPARLTAFFPASDGGWSLAIIRNEWRVLADTAWDVTVVGPEITIRRKAEETVLQFRMQPPYRFEIIRLDVNTEKYSAKLEPDGFHILDATRRRRVCFGNSSSSAGVLAFVSADCACLTAPFPDSSPHPEVSWQDLLLHGHWEAGRRTHGSLIIRPDGGQPKRIEGEGGTTIEIASLKLYDQKTGVQVNLKEEAEVLTLFSFGSSHLQLLSVGGQAVGSI